jgi:Ca-activated chloride channel family protein
MEVADVWMKRIDLAKKFLNEFLEKQRENEVSLVLFAWKAFISIPLTFDYDILSEVLENLSTNTDKSLDGTAIWDAIIMASKLLSSPLSSNEDIPPHWGRADNVIILLTDWDINAGIPLETAILEAKNKGIKIHSIWIWWEEKTELNDWSGTYEIASLNEELLKEIAINTGGEYFRNTFPTFLIGAEKIKLEDRVNEFFVFSLLWVLFLYLILVLWKP